MNTAMKYLFPVWSLPNNFILLGVCAESTELVMLNFYADWCRFSQMLSPIWDDLAVKVREAFPDESKVVIGKVDCEKEGSIATRYWATMFFDSSLKHSFFIMLLCQSKS